MQIAAHKGGLATADPSRMHADAMWNGTCRAKRPPSIDLGTPARTPCLEHLHMI